MDTPPRGGVSRRNGAGGNQSPMVDLEADLYYDDPALWALIAMGIGGLALNFRDVSERKALEEQLRALRRRQVENPPDHTGWLESFEELRKRFLTTARNQEGPLGEGLARHVEHLHERLRTLRGMPLSAAVRQESENLEDEIRDLTRHPGDGQTLHRLRRTGEIERHLEELRRQAAEGLKELEERGALETAPGEIRIVHADVARRLMDEEG